MLPTSSKAWTFIIVACIVGFVIGQWLKARRDRAEKSRNAYLNSLKRMALAESPVQTKKAKRKRQKNR